MLAHPVKFVVGWLLYENCDVMRVFRLTIRNVVNT